MWKFIVLHLHKIFPYIFTQLCQWEESSGEVHNYLTALHYCIFIN